MLSFPFQCVTWNAVLQVWNVFYKIGITKIST
jgi:hypothetical protein